MARTKFKKIPFDLELAKKITNKEVKGRIVSEDGRKVRIIYIDNESFTETTFLALYKDKDFNIERDYRLNKDGRYFRGERSDLDLHIEVPKYRDYSNFVPQRWQPCLVRDGENLIWYPLIYAYTDCQGKMLFYDGSYIRPFANVLPLSKVTERLVGTTKSYEGLIQELDGNEQD